MKIAICISGQPRHYEIGYVSLKKAILDKYDCDIFIHTWWDDKEGVYDRSGFADRREVNENPIYKDIPEGINSLYKPKSFIHEPQKPFNLNDKGFELSAFITPFMLYSQKYSIKQANDLKSEYEKQNEIEYEWVIRMRFDLDLDLMRLDLSKYDSKYIYINAGVYQVKTDTNYGIDDCLAIGSSKNIDVYSNLYEKLNKYLIAEKQKAASEHIIYHHLVKNKIPSHYDKYRLTFIGDKDWRLRNPEKDIVKERELIRQKYL